MLLPNSLNLQDIKIFLFEEGLFRLCEKNDIVCAVNIQFVIVEFIVFLLLVIRSPALRIQSSLYI